MATQRTAGAVFDFAVLPMRLRSQCLGDQGLRGAAVAAPLGAKLQQGQALPSLHIG
jgi:hypothetical protein